LRFRGHFSICWVVHLPQYTKLIWVCQVYNSVL
jgi:hypothetical protein